MSDSYSKECPANIDPTLDCCWLNYVLILHMFGQIWSPLVPTTAVISFALLSVVVCLWNSPLEAGVIISTSAFANYASLFEYWPDHVFSKLS